MDGIDAICEGLCHAARMNQFLPMFLVAFGAVCSLAAQETKPAVPPTPAAAEKAPAAPEPPTAPVNLLATVETWTLSKTDFAALLDGPADERAPYDRLEALAKAGKAQLTGLISVSTKTGGHGVVESIDGVPYPTEFEPGDRAHDIAFPIGYNLRNVGDTLELEPVLGEDGKTIEVNIVTQSIRFDGFHDRRTEPHAMPFGQPQFREEKVTTSTKVVSGRPVFLATATTAAPDGPDAKQVNVRVLRVTAQRAQPSAPIVGDLPEARVELLIYSLKRETARRILNADGDSAQSFAAVRELVAKGEAQIETVDAFLTKSGERAVNEEIVEYHHLGHINPPSYPSAKAPAERRYPAMPSTFETRHLGLTVEVEAVFRQDARFVDLNIVPQIVRMAGMLKVTGVAAKYPPKPVFTTRKLTANVSIGTGEPVLLGTISPPRDDGVNNRKDDGRTSLAYVRVTAVRP